MNNSHEVFRSFLVILVIWTPPLEVEMRSIKINGNYFVGQNFTENPKNETVCHLENLFLTDCGPNI